MNLTLQAISKYLTEHNIQHKICLKLTNPLINTWIQIPHRPYPTSIFQQKHTSTILISQHTEYTEINIADPELLPKILKLL